MQMPPSKGTRATTNGNNSSLMPPVNHKAQSATRNVANLFNSMQMNRQRNESGLSSVKVGAPGPHQLYPPSRQHNPMNSTKDLGELRNKRVSEMTSSDRPIESSMGKWQDTSDGLRANSRLKDGHKANSNIDMNFVMNQSNSLEDRKRREQHLGILSVDSAYDIVRTVHHQSTQRPKGMRLRNSINEGASQRYSPRVDKLTTDGILK